MTSLNEILCFLGEQIAEANFQIDKPVSPDRLCPNSITLVTRPGESLDLLSERAPRNVFVLAPLKHKRPVNGTPVFFSFRENPRLDFCRILQNFFVSKEVPFVDSTAIVRTNHALPEDISIGAGCVIRGDVTFGKRSIIMDHVIIYGPAVFGDDVVIKAGALIGQSGFGFERDCNGNPIRFPHFGRVLIGDRVEVGSFSIINRSTLDDTTVGSDTKLDDRTHVGHNAKIGSRVLIASGVVICGGAQVGDDVWVGPNSVISNGIKLGNKSFVTLGSIVTRDVTDNERVSGNFAIAHHLFMKSVARASLDSGTLPIH